MQKSSIKAITLLVLLGVIWGSGYSIARYATTHGVPPLGYSFWQSVGPAIFLLMVSIIKGEIIISAHTLRYYVIVGVLGIALPNTNMYFAAPHLPAGILAVIVNTVPIMMYPLALLARQEKFNKVRMLGVMAGIVGILLIVMPHNDYSLIPNPWALITLFTPFFFAMCALYSVHDRPAGVSSLNLATGMLVTSAIMLLPLVIDLHEFYPLTSFSLPNISVMVEIILSSIGYIIFFQLLKVAGAVYYSLVGGIVAMTGLFWGWLFFGETLGVLNIIAIMMIIIALVVVSLVQRHQ